MLSRLTLMVTVLLATPALALEAQRVKIEGVWQGDELVAHVVKERDPRKDQSRLRLLGQVRSLDRQARTFLIGPVALGWTTETAADLTLLQDGSAVEVDAVLGADGKSLIVQSLQPAQIDKEGQIELMGSVQNSVRDGRYNRLTIGGVSVRVPVSLYSNGRVRLRRFDDNRPAEQLVVPIGPTQVTIGGEFELSSDTTRNRDLDDASDDDEVQFETGAQLEAFADITPSVSAYLEVKLGWEQDYVLPWSSDGNRFELQRGEMWLFFDRPFDLPFSIQAGRQNFAEEREWWWDADLDALRVFFGNSRWSADVAIAQELGREVLDAAHVEAEDSNVLRLLASARRTMSSQVILQAFFLHQWDRSTGFQIGDVSRSHKEDEDDSNLTWVGGRVSGERSLGERVQTEYWADLAFVWGEETVYDFDDLDERRIIVEDRRRQDRRGWAVDAGISLELDHALQPTLTFGYAYGSGDENAKGTFRETGLNDFNGRFNGVSRFRYYGELSRPELSNVSISTLALGRRFGEAGSIELIHHGYRQVQRSTEHPLRIDQDSNGRSNELGDELNLVLSMEQWKHWELELVLNYFRLGPAFDQNDGAWSFSSKLNYNF